MVDLTDDIESFDEFLSDEPMEVLTDDDDVSGPKELVLPIIPIDPEEERRELEIFGFTEAEGFVDLLADKEMPAEAKKYYRKTIKNELNTEMKLFLKFLMATGTVTDALKKAGLPIVRYRAWLESVPVFNTAVQDITDTLADKLEAKAFKMALNGNVKVLLKSLEALRPQKWGKSSTINSYIEGKMRVDVVNWADLVKQAESEVVDVRGGSDGLGLLPGVRAVEGCGEDELRDMSELD